MIDLYAQQYGSRLEDARSFQMYLGGSSGNVAFGVARLGLKTAMISRVGIEISDMFGFNRSLAAMLDVRCCGAPVETASCCPRA